MSLLSKPCARCKGRGRIRNLLLPGSHICRRCDGAGEVLTWAGRAIQRIAGPSIEEDF